MFSGHYLGVGLCDILWYFDQPRHHLDASLGFSRFFSYISSENYSFSYHWVAVSEFLGFYWEGRSQCRANGGERGDSQFPLLTKFDASLDLEAEKDTLRSKCACDNSVVNFFDSKR
jgi:hypothetical protein